MPDPTDTTVTLTPEALQAIDAMHAKVADIGMHYGHSSEEYVKALESLAAVLSQVLRLGGRITRDGDGLYGASFIAYGVVFSAKHVDGVRTAAGEWSVHS